MNTITNDWFLEASRWLWDYFLLATVLLAVVLVLGKFLAQPARRMAVHWSTAAGLVLLALLCAVPGWSIVNLFSEPPLPPTVWVEDLVPKTFPKYQPQVIVTEIPTIAHDAPTSPPVETATPVYAAYRTYTIDWAALSLFLVAAGSILFSLWLALGHWQMRRIRSQAKPAPPELTALLPQLTPTGQRTPTLGIVAQLPVAAAVGLRRPMVLLPQNFLKLADPEKLQSVLAHELAHIRHRDLWLLALLRGLLLVLWPHPLYWLWRRTVRLDQETLADAAAADVTDRTHYAEQLVAWARVATESKTPRLASSVGLWESPSQLKRRIAILLDEKLTVLRECSRRWRVGSALGMLAIAGGLSLITLSPAETQVALAESSETATPSNSLIQARQQFLKRLDGMGMGKPNNIFGICMDEKGQPLAGVSLQIYVQRVSRSEENARPILETISDAKGEFVFNNVVDVAKEFPEGLPEEYFQGPEANTLTLQGRVKGRVTYISSGSPADIARSSQAHVCVMPPAKVLRGRVTDNAGQPVAGAKVGVGYYATTPGGSQGINTATTDANGEYVIDDLLAYSVDEARRYFERYQKNDPNTLWDGPVLYKMPLLIRHPKFAAKRVTIEHIPGSIDVQLVPGSVIEGTVQFPEGNDTTNKTLAGSLVHLRRVVPLSKPGEGGMYDNFSFRFKKATIDEKGHYRFASLPAGKYHLTADVEGWVTQGVENIEVAQGESTTAPGIMLMHGGRVQIQLVDSKTGESMRFEEPTKGFLNVKQRSPRSGITFFRDNIVDYSNDGLVEIQMPAGNYTFHALIPNPDGKSDLHMVLPKAMDEWPVEKVVDGELLKISILMEVRERKLNGEAKPSYYTSDEAAVNEKGEVIFAPAPLPAQESKAGDTPISNPQKSSRADRTYVDDRFIFCPVKTELQRKLLGISRGESEEASLCVLVHSEALKTKLGKIDNEALGYPNITKRLKEYAKENNHLVVFRILGSVNTGEPFDDIQDRMEVLSWAFKGLGQHAGFRQCQASQSYGIVWEKMVDRAEQASADTWDQDEPSSGNDLIRIYPVRTFLSRCLTAGDCVVDVLPVIRHAEGEVLKPEILESLAKHVPQVEIPNRSKLLLKLRITEAAGEIVDQLSGNISKRKDMASTLGFRDIYTSTSWVAE